MTDWSTAARAPWRGVRLERPVAISVRDVFHPVGRLPAAVYWRRRVLLLGLVLGLVVGGGWVSIAVATGSGATDVAAAAANRPGAPAAGTPSLERVVPSLAAVQVPTVPAAPRVTTPTATATTATQVTPTVVTPPARVVGGPCADDMITVEVRASPASAPVGSKPTFDLVVTNVSPVSCVRALDQGLQEIVLLDAAGARVWGSNDCFPAAGTDLRTLAAGQVVDDPVVWGGLTSEPTCTAPRVPPAAGAYVLRGRLDTKLSADAPFTLT